MYGLDVQTDFGFLVGSRLIQACFGENELILRFDAPAVLTVEGDFGVGANGASVYSRPSDAAGSVVGLLGQDVTAYEIGGDGHLALTFSGGAFVAYDSSREYESYQLTFGGRTWVV